MLDAVRLRLAEAGAVPTTAEVAAALRAARPPLGGDDLLDTVSTLRAELVGAGPLEALLGAPDVTDVLVNAPDEVWVDRGSGLCREPSVRFPDVEAVRHLAHRLATAAGRRLDDARPWVDARLPDGTRLHAVLPPIAAGCTHISLRISRQKPFEMAELEAAGALGPTAAELLGAVVRARLSLLISGGTGSGKTTLLAALLGLVGRAERIVIAEDSAELRPSHPHVVRLQSRPPNQEGLGELTLRDLVRQALRMRPDRLVVGEVRGSEVLDLLAALNTGHEGAWLAQPYMQSAGPLRGDQLLAVPLAGLHRYGVRDGPQKGRVARLCGVRADGLGERVHVGRCAVGAPHAQSLTIGAAGDPDRGRLRVVPDVVLPEAELLPDGHSATSSALMVSSAATSSPRGSETGSQPLCAGR
ncbi:TadA family conjugal transfer-associated ATPase [Kitasatospora sp. GAS1066B]|uniref:TadA family conjugal transfer-associated ATPase n=1 Tax=Kitasatospora sp. GAS1066B TaxID=3156271 RepID=UPI003516DC40